MKLPRVIAGGRGVTLALLVANGLAQAGATIVAMLLTRSAFDQLVLARSDAAAFLPLGAGLLGAAIGTAALMFLERVDAERLGQSYAREIRSFLFSRVTRTAPRSLQKRSRGGLALRFSGDLTALRQWASLGVARLCVAGVVTPATLASLAAVNLPIATVAGLILLGGALLSAFLGQPLAASVANARRRRAYLAANLTEKIASVAVLQAHHRLRRERRRVDRQGRRLEHAMVRRATWIALLRAIGEVTGRLAAVAALLVGALEVRSGMATPGVIVAAVAVTALLGQPIRDLGRVFELWSKARQARADLATFLQSGGVVRDAPRAGGLEVGGGALAFDHVAMSPVFVDFDASVPAGTRVAIVGPNGSGKSTLLWLAARLLEPERGRVLLDGQDLRSLTLRSVRRAIGIVGEGLPLLRGTIAYNVAYRRPNASPEEIAAACTWSGLDEVLAELPDGLETRLTDQGGNLSEGQKQRVALARALLGRPRLLLLDELEAKLDPRGRAGVTALLRDYPGTVLVVTQEPDWIRSADVVWYLADGKLVAPAPPEQRRLGGEPALARASACGEPT